MDISYLLKILARRKWLIFSVMLAAAAAMYLFIGRKAAMYKASVTLSTGIVNYKGIKSNDKDAFVQEYQVENAFSNLIEIAKSRASIKLLTIRMLKHDLGAEGGSAASPFRQPNPKLVSVSPEETQQLLTQIQGINLDSISDPAFSQQFDLLLDRVSRAYGYDNDAVLRSMEVKRKGETDYLSIEFTTEKDSLSQFLANTYVKQFMTYYQNLRQRENKTKVDFYNDLVDKKQAQIDSVRFTIYEYRKRKVLPTVSKQAEELINQISQLEIQKQRAKSKERSSAESVEKLDGYIDDKQSLHSENTRDRVVDKYAVLDMKDKVDKLKQESLKKGKKDPKVEKDLAAAEADYQKLLSESSRSVAKKHDKRDEDLKDDLYIKRVDASLDEIDAGESASEIQAKINLATGQLREFVADDQFISEIAAQQARYEKEYDGLSEKLTSARLAYQTNENPLNIIENAQFPEWPEGDNQMLLSVFAGIVAGTMATIFIFLLAYFDSSIQSPSMFKRYSNDLPLLGAVNTVKLKNLDLKHVFSSNGEMPQYKEFRENLRKMRTLILQSPGKVFLFVSTKPGEGKSFTMNALAHSLSANGKRVLLLDTNFKNAGLSQFADEPSSNSGLLNRAIREHGLTDVFQLKQNSAGFALSNVEVVGNTGRHQSPMEMMDGKAFQNFLTDLGETYDYVFMESAAINIYSDARELAPFADKIIAVFNAGSVIKAVDEESIGFLQGMNGQFAGAVLTDVDLKNMN